jgi:hypothetical protein
LALEKTDKDYVFSIHYHYFHNYDITSQQPITWIVKANPETEPCELTVGDKF